MYAYTHARTQLHDKDGDGYHSKKEFYYAIMEDEFESLAGKYSKVCMTINIIINVHMHLNFVYAYVAVYICICIHIYI